MAARSRRFPPRSSLSARHVLRNLVAFALLYGAGLAAVWGFSLLGVSTLVAFPVFVLGALDRTRAWRPTRGRGAARWEWPTCSPTTSCSPRPSSSLKVL